MKRKLIILNSGTATHRDITSCLPPETTVEAYKTRDMCISVCDTGVSFFCDNIQVSFANSYVFTRYHSLASHFCGVLSNYLMQANIPFAHKVMMKHPYANEKIAQIPLLANAKLPIVESFIMGSDGFRSNQEHILSQIDFPVVFKMIGSQGDNVHLVHDSNALKQYIPEDPFVLFTLQKYIPNKYDVRVIVAYDTVLGAIKRKSDSFLNNFSKGGLVELHELSEKEKAISLAAAEVCGIDLAGVDLIYTEENEPKLIEVNSGPQIKGFESIFGKGFVMKKVASLVGKQLRN